MATIIARKRKSGISYTAQIRIMKNGLAIYSESKTFSKKALAKEWADRREGELRGDPSAISRIKHRGVTVGDLIQAYIDDRAALDQLGRSKSSDLRRLLGDDIARFDAQALTTQDLIAHVRNRRLAGTGPATVNNDLVWLRGVFRYARTALGVPVQLQIFTDASDLSRSERLISRPKKRKRRPTDDELLRIGDWFNRTAPRGGYSAPMYLITWFAIYSCRRLAEIMRLRLSDFDRGSHTWLVRDMKNPSGSAGNDGLMLVPENLIPVIDAAISAVDRGDDDRLFPFNERTVSSNWTQSMKVLGIDDLHFHDLRHEGCSRLAEDGKTIPEIQHVSLHESWSSLQVYVNMRRRSGQRMEF